MINHLKIVKVEKYQGRPQDLEGGPRIILGGFRNLHVASPCALIAMWFGGMPLREIFYKWCNSMRFGVYLDQILTSKCTIFYIFFF